jgi:hypothetical protein
MDFSFAFLFKTCRLAVLFKRNDFFLPSRCRFYFREYFLTKFNLEVRIFRKVLSRLFLVIFEKSSNIASAFDEKFHSPVP